MDGVMVIFPFQVRKKGAFLCGRSTDAEGDTDSINGVEFCGAYSTGACFVDQAFNLFLLRKGEAYTHAHS
jgi:hypothetical protein